MPPITALTVVNDVSATSKMTVNHRDYHFDNRSVSFPVLETIVDPADALVVAVANTTNTLTTAQICSLRLNEALARPTGGDPAVSGSFSEVSDFVRAEFVSLTECRSSIFVDILAPLDTIMTGSDQRELNLANASVILWRDAMLAVLKDPRYGGITDFALREGLRNRIAKEPRRAG